MNRRSSQRGARTRRPRAVDPGVRAARWAAVRRWAARSALATVVAAVLAGGVWGTAWLMAPDTFPLESVYFDSRLEHVRETDLREALDGRLDDGFWALDLDAIRASLEELPWVETAAVRRIWPGHLRVQIREHEAAAVWNDSALLSTAGEVFEAAPDSRPPDLPELAGPDERAEEVAERFRELALAMERIGFAVTGLSMDARESWTAELDTGARIRLGREDINARLQRFVSDYPGLVREQDRELARADLRYPNGFSVRWRDDDNNAPN